MLDLSIELGGIFFMKRYLVLSGTHAEYDRWRRESGVDLSQANRITSIHSLIGIHPTEQIEYTIIYTGEFWKHPMHNSPQLLRLEEEIIEFERKQIELEQTNNKSCTNCVYYLAGEPNICNAFHTPPVESCVDWELKQVETQQVRQESVERNPLRLSIEAMEQAARLYWPNMQRLIARERQLRGIPNELDLRPGDIRGDLDRNPRRDERELEIYAFDADALTLSQLEGIKRNLPNPLRHTPGETYNVCIVNNRYLDCTTFNPTTPPPRNPIRRRNIYFTLIACNGIKTWQYEGKVIL